MGLYGLIVGFPASKSLKRAPTSTGSVAVSPYFKVEFGKLYNIFPSQKCNFFTQISCFAHYFDTFELLFRKYLFLPEEDGIIKNRSYERRHQSDTVCQNIFDSCTYDSARHPLNITQIDKIMPYHQT